MTLITGRHSFHVLHRHVDVSGISGTGPIAYLLDLAEDGQLLLWDTSVGSRRDIPTHGIEIMPNRTLVDLIHGHDGATTVEALTGPLHQARLEHLLVAAAPRIRAVADRLDPRPELDVGPRDGTWFRTGRSNPRNLYLVTGRDWQDDIPVGSLYKRRMGVLAADALNAYCAQHPGLVPRHRAQLVGGEHAGPITAQEGASA